MVKTTAQTFFSDEERQRIKAAVFEAEKRTSGEIVPMVVDTSYDYPRAEILGAVLLSLATGVTASWAFGDSSVWFFLPIFALAYFPFKFFIRYTPTLKRCLIHPVEICGEVEEKALVSFLEQGLHHTRNHTGILILLSLFERRVYVLADRGINARVPLHVWEEIVETVTEGIHQGLACDALCEAITRCAELLEEHFPSREDDRNELPDLILG